jgi:hypothetical protein
MKYILLIAYILLITLLITGYAVLFDIEILGGDAAIVGYKVLWGINGAGFAVFYYWIVHD